MSSAYSLLTASFNSEGGAKLIIRLLDISIFPFILLLPSNFNTISFIAVTSPDTKFMDSVTNFLVAA